MTTTTETETPIPRLDRQQITKLFENTVGVQPREADFAVIEAIGGTPEQAAEYIWDRRMGEPEWPTLEAMQKAARAIVDAKEPNPAPDATTGDPRTLAIFIYVDGWTKIRQVGDQQFGVAILSGHSEEDEPILADTLEHAMVVFLGIADAALEFEDDGEALLKVKADPIIGLSFINEISGWLLENGFSNLTLEIADLDEEE